MTETPPDWQSIAAALNSQLAVERENGHWLGELLAVIHCDGGHYQSEHGTKKATADAIKKRNEMVMRIDELEDQLAAERELREQYFDTMERQHKQVQVLVDALKQVREWHDINTHTGQFIDTTLAKMDSSCEALAKQEDQPVQLPMINDDPVVELK